MQAEPKIALFSAKEPEEELIGAIEEPELLWSNIPASIAFLTDLWGPLRTHMDIGTAHSLSFR